jgi:8-oxo-dGTP diphosphatase
VTHVYLVRHAKAKKRAKWTEPDHLRPLAKAGRRQAAALPALYEAQPFARLFTSPHVRCVQTLEPLAEARGLPLETADALAEGAPAGEALELMLSLAAEGAVACCTHADVMFDAVEELVSAGARLEGPFEFEVAGTWILDVEDRMFSVGRYLPPPPLAGETPLGLVL